MTIPPLRAPLLSPDAPQLTPAERTYLRVISYLASRAEPVIAAQIARWRRVRPPTVAQTLRRLEQKQLISRDATNAISLTATGTATVAAIVRRHRLLECFLATTLEVPWYLLYREAATLEPVMSSLFEERITILVGAVTTCPHGYPLASQPAAVDQDVCLLAIPPGAWFSVTRIDEVAGDDVFTLRMLWTRGLLPGTTLQRLPDADGATVVEHAAQQLVLTRRVASILWGTTAPNGASQISR